jgi:alkylation response protein AidB-like acyl-CoA dehydrogenase
MPIDFTLNDNQRRLRREARQFAKDVLSGVPVATRPFYEGLVAEGFLRKCIPVSVGGDCAGLVDLAILAEEFYTVDANVSVMSRS